MIKKENEIGRHIRRTFTSQNFIAGFWIPVFSNVV